MSQTPQDLPELIAALDDLRAKADASFAAVARAHPAEMACHTGCDDCCHALFDLAPVEVLALGLAFLDLPRKQRREVLRRGAKASGEFQRVLDRAAALAPDQRLAELSRARVACPLLDGGRCLLYAHRPLTCRLYGVPTAIAGEARICFRTGFQTGRSYPTVDLGLVQAELDRLSGAALKLVPGLPAKRLDLGQALELAAGWPQEAGAREG